MGPIKALAALILLTVLPALSQAETALLLSNDPTLLDTVQSKLPAQINVLRHRIDSDQAKETFVTDEGQTIRFSALFHTRSLKVSQERERLYLEYAPDYLILAWIADESQEKYENYGVSKSTLKAVVRILDGKTGDDVLTKSLKYSTELALDKASESDASRSELIDSALEKLTPVLIEEKIAKNLEKRQGLHYRLRVVVKDIDQETYFSSRSDLLTVVEQAGVSGPLRDSYNRAGKELTVRVEIEQDIETFYRSLYAAATSSEAIDNFSLEKSGIEIEIKLLPPEPKVVSVKALNPEDYRNAGRGFIEIVSNINGVSDVEQVYSENNQTLTLTFSLKGSKLYAVDKAIWEGIKDNPVFKELALGELDNKELEYFFSGGADRRTGDLIIHMRHVSPQDYKKVATEFADILGKANGVRNLRYSYQFTKKTIVFRLSYEGENMFALDDGLQRSMLENDTFKFVAKGPEELGRLVYIYSTTAEQAATIAAHIAAGGDDKSRVVLSTELEKLHSSVVYLYVESTIKESEGSGFIVSRQGHILTNEHVIGIDEGYVYVRTYDGTQYRAEVIKSDKELDLALVRIVSARSKQFPAVSVGNSNDIKAGDSVTVIGNPLGARFEHSVLTGIISGSNRESGLLQLSVPMYSGISGAPVFDSKGRVIGVMVASPLFDQMQIFKVGNELKKVASARPAEGIGLAIPINHARNILRLAMP